MDKSGKAVKKKGAKKGKSKEKVEEP